MPWPRSLAERFWERVDKSAGPDACWLWTGRIARNGYGQIGLGGRGGSVELVHRVALYLANGVWPNWATHACDNKACCNAHPNHVREGTPSSNLKEAYDRGLRRRPEGELHPQAWLTEADVSEIRKLAASGMTQAALAAVFGVSKPHISRIVTRKVWR